MRLHGRREIMGCVDRSSQNQDGWRMIREQYADAIRCC